MGNQLAGIASSQILSVDHYFTDLPQYEFDSSLGSTRFFKVARAKYKEGLAVVKVFAIQDPSLPLKSYQDELKEIKAKLQGAPNVLCFLTSILSDKSSILIRQYCKDNLYDRISTRPFLNTLEKKWIVFPLLSALDQCHSMGVCHGDIKTENVMVTGWNWLLLTDIASFKPVFLPEDNPADFSFFFDTSRRRVCYIAPERFLDSQQNDTLRSSINSSMTNSQGSDYSSPLTSLPDIDIANHKKGKLTPAMDIFSAGCVISELFLEGTALFDLSQLLAYRSGDYDPTPTLENITNPHIRELVSHMIQKDAHLRHSAGKYIELYKGSIFPDQFYSFLKTYISRFAMAPVLTPDEKILRIKRDIEQILQELSPSNNNSETGAATDEESKGILVIILSLVTSCIRSCKFCVSKLSALDLLTNLSSHVSDEVILERLIPSVLFLVQDSLARVRAKALKTLTTCLQMVQNVPRSDANIFPEYILPSLSALTQDTEVLVRVAYAENIAGLAETALRFLEITQLEQYNEEEETDAHIHYQASYDVELQALHEIIQRKVVTLLSDAENVVKQTLLENGITRLCVFFGRQKANDVLLSHMITFLNDKLDWQLRGAFFDSIVGVAAYVGWQSLAMLKPLLQQGLSDTEEFVICKALHALTCLAELGLLQKPTLNEFAAEVVSFLVHPSMWVRYGAVGFISSVARTLNIADVHCNLLPLLHPYIKQPIVQVDQEVLLVSVLKEPVSRAIYDYIIRIPQISLLFDSLQHRQLLRNICRPGQSPDYHEPAGDLVIVYRKLQSQGLTEYDEDKLLFLKDIMLKLHRAKMSVELSSSKNDEGSLPGEINLKTVAKKAVRRHADMVKVEKPGTISGKQKNQRKSVQLEANYNSPAVLTSVEGGSYTTLSTQRHSGPAQNPATANLKKGNLTRTVSLPSNLQEKTTATAAAATSATMPASQSGTVPKQDEGNSMPPTPSPTPPIPMQNLSQPLPRYAVCRMDLRQLVHHKRDQYASYTKSQAILGSLSFPESKSSSSKWNPKGTLIAHLHEHKAAINRLAVSQDSMFLASASDDGTVKIWESQKLEGKTWVNKSRQSYNRLAGKVKALTFCQSSLSLACASEEGSVHVFRIERPDQSAQLNPPPKLTFLHQRALDPKADGHIVDLAHFDSGSQSVLTYATSHGLLCGWDLRSQGLAWSLQNDPAHGLTTSFVVDPCQCWLTVGTSTGTMVCWDLRFKLPITSLTHPRSALIRCLRTHPLEKSWVLAAVQGNNEVSMWDLETGSQRQTLWASHAPPLSQSQVSTHAVNTICACPPETSPYILTAGSDKRIRLWDMAYPEQSRIIAAAATDNLHGVVLQYKSQLIDGTEVYQEVNCKPRQGVLHEDMPRRGPEQPPVGHHDTITDLALVKTSQTFLASSSRDGVLKIWK